MTRIGIIADVHADAEALRMALAQIAGVSCTVDAAHRTCYIVLQQERQRRDHIDDPPSRATAG